MDCVFLEGLIVYAYHGTRDAEKELGRPFRFDVWMFLDTRQAGQRDDINLTADYALAVECLRQVSNECSRNTLECLAEKSVERLFDQFPMVNRIRLRVAKLYPPVDFPVSMAGVEIDRARKLD
jgi:dihydroneopterin aldolase